MNALTGKIFIKYIHDDNDEYFDEDTTTDKIANRCSKVLTQIAMDNTKKKTPIKKDYINNMFALEFM